MGGAIMRKAAGEIAGLEEIVGEGFEHIVEGALAMRPGLEEVPDIEPAAFARGADQGRRHRHLVKRLVPDIVEPLGLRHPRPDAGIDEVEEKQSGQPLRRHPRQRLHRRAADIVADDADPRQLQRIQQRQHVRRMLVGAERSVGLVAVAEAAQVRRQQRVTIGKPPHQRLKGQPEFGPAMQQQQRRPGPGAGDMEAGAIGANRQMFHGWFPSLRRATAREFCAPAACLASHPRLELGPTAAVRSARMAPRRGGRVVDRTALEMRHRCKPIGGSNPSLSANKSLKLKEKIYSRGAGRRGDLLSRWLQSADEVSCLCVSEGGEN